MKSNWLKPAMAVAVTALLCAAVSSCSKDKASTVNPPTLPKPKNDVRLATSAQFGTVLTDSLGNTLYFFSIDANGSSGCTGNCIAAWPVFYRATPKLDSGLNASDFGTITRTDGASQTTYKGWPLYYYAADSKPGDITGDNVGKVWYVAKPDYSVMIAKTQLVGNDTQQYDSLFKVGAGQTTYITDDYGRTLYSFSPDHFRKNTFTKPDLSNNGVWPCDTVTKVMNIPSLLDRTQFDTIQIYGKVQLVYKGWPLYYFGNDKGTRGSTRGVSVPTPGFWPYVNANSPVAPN